jgi:hypothetical protein
MIKKIKNLLKKIPLVVKLDEERRFFREIPARGILNFKKLKLFTKVKPYTKARYLKLSNVYDLATLIEKSKIKGAFVECGVWKGGCAAVMAFVANRAKSSRKIWLFDSFEGLPEPTSKDFDKNGVFGKEFIEKNIASVDDVREIFFKILKMEEKNIVIKKGWFKDTLPLAKKEIGPIAILRLDADFYESTKCCLDNLYDNVISGGYIIIDDYHTWQGCKEAVDEFLIKRGLKVKMINIDGEGTYFQKPWNH